MSLSALIFFMLFSIVMVVMYIAIRRNWVSPAVAAGAGIVAGTFAMIMTLMESNSEIMNLQAIFFGFIISMIFSMATLAVAWYFHSNELREQFQDHAE